MSERPLRASAIAFATTLILVFGGQSVGSKLNVDENAFIASAYLVGHKGLRLYRDFHYYHMPTMVLIDALLFKFTSHLLLIARAFSAVSASVTVASLYYFASGQFAWMKVRPRIVWAIGIGLSLLFNPIFFNTAGRAWNHDFPAMCSVLAFLLLRSGLAQGDRRKTLAAGALVALAITSRLTFATEMLPFGFFLFLYPALPRSQRTLHAMAFLIGGVLAASPSLWIWARSFPQAWFGNFVYPGLSMRLHAATDNAAHQRYSHLAKLGYYLKEWINRPGYGLLSIATFALIAACFKWRRVLSDLAQFQLATLMLLFASQLFGGLAPSPPFEQYLYGATPFMPMIIASCLTIRRELAQAIIVRKLLVIGLAACLPFAVAGYDGIWHLFVFHRWVPVEIHDRGLAIRRYTGPGRVMTLEPVYPAEAGLDIYPELATGRFAIRIGDFLTPTERQAFHLFTIEEMVETVDRDRPCGVLLTGTDDRVGAEAALEGAAESAGYRPIKLPTEQTVWIEPK